MAGKYAVIWTTSRGYMPGTNASLNAMEFYGWKNVDVFILTGGDCLPASYKESWPFVTFIDFESFAVPGKDSAWYYRYMDIIYALDLFEKGYDSILLWGGDLCVLDDFTEYFEISDKLGAMVLGTNEHGTHRLETLPKVWPYGHTWHVPYADVPFFVPECRSEVLKLMLEYSQKDDCLVQRMDGMNYAVRDCNAKVHSVPGELWIQNVPYRWRVEVGKDKAVYLRESSTRLKSFHRKYWNTTVCRQYLPGGLEPWSAISRSNKLVFNGLYNFFNRNCRVKWTETLEVWDGK